MDRVEPAFRLASKIAPHYKAQAVRWSAANAALNPDYSWGSQSYRNRWIIQMKRRSIRTRRTTPILKPL